MRATPVLPTHTSSSRDKARRSAFRAIASSRSPPEKRWIWRQFTPEIIQLASGFPCCSKRMGEEKERWDEQHTTFPLPRAVPKRGFRVEGRDSPYPPPTLFGQQGNTDASWII